MRRIGGADDPPVELVFSLVVRREFEWLWAAFAVSAAGTWLAFDAFPLIAILALDASPAAVSLLAAAGLAAGSVAAVPLGAWADERRKRSVMVGLDLVRFTALATVPLAFVAGALTFVQLLVVAMVVAAADIGFRAASGAYLKWLVPGEQLLRANGRFEMTQWTAITVGPPVGGALIGVVGPVATVAANAASFLGSAAALGRIRRPEPAPPRTTAPDDARRRRGELLEGWRVIRADAQLRRLLVNTVANNALILAPTPLLAVLMLGELGFPPWQYGLAFALPCLGGIAGARLARPLVARYGRRRVLLAAGGLRACWPLPLAFVGSGAEGLALVLVVQLGLVTCNGVFNPVFATTRLERCPPAATARTLATWSMATNATVAVTTALLGVLAGLTDPRVAIGVAGVLLLLTPLALRGAGGPAATSTG